MSSSNSKTTAAHFDEAAKTWAQEPRRVLLGQRMAEVIAESVPLNEDMRVLDFGCGVGLVSVPLAPRVGAITAADNSSGMLAALDERLRETGITNVMPLALPASADALGKGAFDLVFTCMVLHHVENVDAQLRQFALWCAPGGYLIITDLEQEDGSFHEGHQGFVHHGFDPHDLAKRLTALGFRILESRTVHTMKRDRGEEKDKEYPLFLLVAQRDA